ncbi:MAG: filamentous hemagglutinin N-terminal domain-containing protein, partial [Cyanothece sp. SIO2G6]|nr:filamentous hemagglutinin N-terminal domain-containing protein [Cyanothece sp. SIO2G6]
MNKLCLLQKYRLLECFTFGILLIIPFLGTENVNSQIVPDNTLGDERSIVNSVGNTDQIDGGAIRGENLFHSFEQFSIEAGRAAYFSNPDVINNIFSRVTGGDRSDIMGTLGVLGDANLFLLNPSGILFGPDATLDIRGAFYTSTAGEITFPDGNTFSALVPGAPPLLTVDVTIPISVEFAGAIPGTPVGNLTNEAKLVLDAGQQLTLQGNTVVSRGELIAPGGTV